MKVRKGEKKKGERKRRGGLKNKSFKLRREQKKGKGKGGRRKV